MSQPRRVLKFRIGEHSFGVLGHEVASTLKCENLQRSPAASGPLGWMLSPKEVEVWQLHGALGLELEDPNGALCLDLEGSPHRALVIDRLEGALSVPESAWFPGLAFKGAQRPALVSAVAVVKGDALPILNLSSLFEAGNTESVAWQPGKPPEATAQAAKQARMASSSPTEQALRAAVAPGADLLVSMSQVRAVTPPVSVSPLPGSPDFVEGVSVLEGEAAWCLDLPKLLGLGESASAETTTRLVWAASSWGNLFVFRVVGEMGTLGADTELDLVEREDFSVPAAILEAAYVGDRLAVVPDLDAIASLSPEETS